MQHNLNGTQSSSDDEDNENEKSMISSQTIMNNMDNDDDGCVHQFKDHSTCGWSNNKELSNNGDDDGEVDGDDDDDDCEDDGEDNDYSSDEDDSVAPYYMLAKDQGTYDADVNEEDAFLNRGIVVAEGVVEGDGRTIDETGSQASLSDHGVEIVE